MYVLYTDDSILAGPDKEELDKAVQDMRDAKLNLTVEGQLEDFLGVNINRQDDKFVLTQPKLIQSIIEELGLDSEGDRAPNIKDIPMQSSKILGRHSDSQDFDRHFHNRRIIGKLNFLADSTRGDIAYPTHHMARFVSNPKKEHGEAIKWLGRYLAGTKDKGLILNP